MSSLTQDQQNALARCGSGIISGALGTIISSLLSFLMPWMLGSAAINVVKTLKSIWKLFSLKSTLKEIGLKVKKRFILKGLCQGFLVKLGSSVLTIGHDDIVEVCTWATSFMIKNSDWISSALKTKLSVLPRLENLRMKLPGVKETSEYMERPVKAYQEAMGWEDTKEHPHRWHAGSREVAGQIFGTGSAVVLMEKFSDRVIDKPAHKTIEYFDRTRHQTNTNRALADLEAHKARIICDGCDRRIGNTAHYHCRVCTGLGFDLCTSCYSLGRRCLSSHSFNYRTLEM